MLRRAHNTESRNWTWTVSVRHLTEKKITVKVLSSYVASCLSTNFSITNNFYVLVVFATENISPNRFCVVKKSFLEFMIKSLTSSQRNLEIPPAYEFWFSGSPKNQNKSDWKTESVLQIAVRDFVFHSKSFARGRTTEQFSLSNLHQLLMIKIFPARPANEFLFLYNLRWCTLGFYDNCRLRVY